MIQQKQPPPKLMSNLGIYVRQYCSQHDVSMERLASNAGLAKATLYALLDPTKDARMSQIISLARAMNVHPQILLQMKWADFDIGAVNPVISKQHFTNSTHEGKLDASAFVNEAPPDGLLIAPNTRFIKSWTIQNVGQTIWHNRFLSCQNPKIDIIYPSNQNSADYHLAPLFNQVAIPTTHPGECVTISVEFISPNISGQYVSYWKMIDEHGNYCFDKGIGLSALILVQTLGVSHVR